MIHTDEAAIFERDFEHAKIPFESLIKDNPEVKDELFQEFLTAPRKPCPILYTEAKGYTDEFNQPYRDPVDKFRPFSKGADYHIPYLVCDSNFDSNLMDTSQECQMLAAQNTLDEKYYCPDLEQTETVKKLREIGDIKTRLESFALHPNIDEKTMRDYARDYAETLLTKLSDLPSNELKSRVYSFILTERENTTITVREILRENIGEARQRHEIIKDAFDVVFSKAEKKFKYLNTTGALTDREVTISEILNPLRGSWNGLIPITNEDFTTIVEDVNYLVISDSLPSKVKSIRHSGTKQFVTRTFYELYNKLYGRHKNPKRKELWIEYLREKFPHLREAETGTMIKKFGQYDGNYEQDLKNQLTY